MAITGNLGPSSRVTALGDLHEVVALRYCLYTIVYQRATRQNHLTLAELIKAMMRYERNSQIRKL